MGLKVTRSRDRRIGDPIPLGFVGSNPTPRITVLRPDFGVGGGVGNVIDSAKELGYIIVVKKDGKQIYKLTDSGRTFLIAQRGLTVQEQAEKRQAKTDKRNFWLTLGLGVIASILAVIAILVAVHYI